MTDQILANQLAIMKALHNLLLWPNKPGAQTLEAINQACVDTRRVLDLDGDVTDYMDLRLSAF